MFFLCVEAMADLLQPAYMASIVDSGVKNADIQAIGKYGLIMVLWVIFAVSLLVFILSYIQNKRAFRNVFLTLISLFLFIIAAGGTANRSPLGVIIIFIVVISGICMLIAPFVFVWAGIVSIKREGLSLPHCLSIIFGVGMWGAFLFIIYAITVYSESTIFMCLIALVAIILCYTLFTFVGFFLYSELCLIMGVAGVAWATLIAQGISAVLSYLVFLRTLRKFSVTRTAVFSGRELAAMAKIALPSILQQSTVSIGMMLVQSVVNRFGSEALAGFSAASRIESICVVPMVAVGNALSSYTAQNIGAGKKDRVVTGYHAANELVVVCAVIICFALETFNHAL